MTTSGDFDYTIGAPLVPGYLQGDAIRLETIEIESFGCRATVVRVPGCAYDTAGLRVRL